MMKCKRFFVTVLFVACNVFVSTALLAGDSTDYAAHKNPLITDDQRNIEAKALELLHSPKITAARKKVARQWRAVAGNQVGEKAWSLFDEMLNEYVFLHLLKAVNGDTNYPKITSMVYAPPHNWFGQRVPGSRSAGPNPDNNYRDAPIDPDAHYEVRGQLLDPEIRDFGLSLMSNAFYTRKLPILEKRDITFNEDGSFVLSIGPEPAGGRENHLQTSPDTVVLFIRDTRTHWNQQPNRLEIKRLDPPAAAPMTDDQIVERAIREMTANVPYSYWWMRISLALEPNLMTKPTNTGEVGGLVTQSTSFGRAELNEDEALVITVSTGGAGYHALSVYDYWYRNLDPAKSMGSFNNAQAAVNADGTITYVVSTQDPGVYNWVDTTGQDQLLLIYRWQNLPLNADERQPLSMDTKRVSINQLNTILPKGIKRVTAEQRKQQIADRQAAYLARYQ